MGSIPEKFVELHKDRCGGCTTAKAIWKNAKSSDPLSTHIHDGKITISIQCTCCTAYKEWTKNYPDESKKLQQYADKLFHYTVRPDKQVKVLVQGKWVLHTGTIYSTKCASIVRTKGDHPYMRTYCFELTHGKSSPLLKKFNRSKNLRCNDLRAIKRGVVYKFCSVSHITNTSSHQTH